MLGGDCDIRKQFRGELELELESDSVYLTLKYLGVKELRCAREYVNS